MISRFVLLALAVAATTSMLANDDKDKFASKLQTIIPEKGTHGFIKVDNNGNEMFYWHFPARNNPKTAPLVFWFQGGPGSSSFYALLFENGPFTVNKSGVFVNEYSWNNDLNMVYVDNPIGTGFSTSSVRDMNQVAQNIQDRAQAFFEAFYELLPEYKGRDVYISGESYAGHHVPYVSNRLHNMMKTNKDIVLKGVAIGNGWVSSGWMYIAYPKILLETKTINQTWHDELMSGMITCKYLMDLDPIHLKSASKEFCDYMYTKAIVDPGTGKQMFNDYDMRKHDDYDDDPLIDWLKSVEVLNELKPSKFNILSDDTVYDRLTRLDWRIDAAPWLKPLLEDGIKVMGYNGKRDYICNYKSGELWTSNLKWSGQEEYNKITEYTKLDFGNLKQYKNFYYMVIEEAGHFVPHDQPLNASKMIKWFISQ